MFLNKYDIDQPVATKILGQAINNKKISHAYLFEKNNYSKCDDYILSFVKDIFCNDIDNNKKLCENICNQIDNNEYIELKILNPIGLQIKKEDALNLQLDLKEKALEGKKRICIINNADKLNSSSSNTLLKFIEDPQDNIIIIIVVENRYQLLKTILSRCQIIPLKMDILGQSVLYIDKLNKLIYNTQNNLSDDQKNSQVYNCLNFIEFYEKNRIDTLLYLNKYFHTFFNNRQDVIYAFNIFKLIYLDALKNKTNTNLELFINNHQIIDLISDSNSLENIIRKINLIINFLKIISDNTNLNLVMDKFIIELEGGINDKCC